MLKKVEKEIKINSGSIINEEAGTMEVAGFEATINSIDPFSMGLAAWVNDRNAYGKNIAKCREDEDAFRSYARELQDEMIAALEEPKELESTE